MPSIIYEVNEARVAAEENMPVSDEYGMDPNVTSNKKAADVEDSKGHIAYDTIEKTSIEENQPLKSNQTEKAGDFKNADNFENTDFDDNQFAQDQDQLMIQTNVNGKENMFEIPSDQEDSNLPE